MSVVSMSVFIYLFFFKCIMFFQSKDIHFQFLDEFHRYNIKILYTILNIWFSLIACCIFPLILNDHFLKENYATLRKKLRVAKVT